LLTSPVAMTRNEFETELRRLLSEHGARTGNQGCVECTGCELCIDCSFCRASKSLLRCHYCVDCERCSDSTHCRGGRELISCHHCTAAERCRSSSYLVRSVDCDGCTYSFGCVGLSRKDFHILNKPYERSAYFALVTRLSRELGLG
jgi:hypothetical protein